MSKKCRICDEIKDLSEFHRANGTRDGHRGECKACFRAQWKARYDSDPERRRRAVERARAWQRRNAERYAAFIQRRNASPAHKRSLRAAHLKRKYGMTPADYERMLAEQSGGCAICGARAPDGQSLHVDHCHDTGRVCGLLCFNCNAGLGMFEHDGARLGAAAAYLRR
jgi:Recombination endonuclease VII